MVLVDTNIWIHLYRESSSRLGELMWSFVAENKAATCGQVLVEYLGGFSDKKIRKAQSEFFIEFPFLQTSRDAFRLAADLRASIAGIGVGDAIIAATAITHKVSLLTLDKDFECFKKRGLDLISIPS